MFFAVCCCSVFLSREIAESTVIGAPRSTELFQPLRGCVWRKVDPQMRKMLGFFTILEKRRQPGEVSALRGISGRNEMKAVSHETIPYIFP